MPGWLAGQPEGEWTLDGDDSIRRRPVDRIAEPLRLMGADVDCRDGRLPPLRVRGARLHGIDYEMPVASAQVKSCLLLAGSAGRGRDHDPRAALDPRPHRADAGRNGRLDPPGGRRADRLPGRAPGGGRRAGAGRLLLGRLLHRRRAARSRAARSRCARSASTATGSGCSRSSPGWGSRWAGRTRSGRAMTVHEIREPGPEPIATLHVRNAPLHGTEVTAEDVPAAIDELPLLALLACFAEGETVVERRRGAAGQGVGPDRGRGRGPLRPRRRHRGAPRRLRGPRDGRAAGRHARRPRRPPPRDGRRDRGPRLRGGRRGRRLRGGRGQLPALRARPAASLLA